MSWRTILCLCLGICALATGGRAQAVPAEDAYTFLWLGRGQNNNWTNAANWLKLAPGSRSLITTGVLYPASTEKATALFLGSRGKDVLLDGSQTLDRMLVGSFSYQDTSHSDFVFKGTGTSTLTLNHGLSVSFHGGMDRLVSTDEMSLSAATTGEYFQSSRAVFDSTLKVALGGSQEWQISSGLLDFFSPLSDAAGTTANRLSLSGYGWINLYGNNTYGAGVGGGTDLTGGITVGVGAATALGSGTVTFQPGSYATLQTINGAVTLPNAIAVKSSQFHLFSQNGALTLAGPITLYDTAGAFVTLYAQGKGVSPVYVGNIGENLTSLSGMRLTIGGEGTVVLQGTNTYSGGTRVYEGSLVVRTTAAIPAVGDLSAALDTGYLGLATPPASPTDLQSAFVNRFNRAETTGTIGFDTLPGQPVNQFAGSISLADPDGTGPLAAFNGQARLGSASSAILSGTITPQNGTYRFGGGGGRLDVTSNLVDQSGAIPTPRSLTVQSPAEKPLTLRLNPSSGVNSFSGGTSVTQSALVFTSANALPATGNFTLDVGGYIGLQLASDVVDATAAVSGLPAFLARFPTLLSQGYVGLDSADRNTTRVVSGLNLADFDGAGASSAGFSSPSIRLSTTTNLNLTGNLTLPTATTQVYLAGYKGGILNVSSTLTDGLAARYVVVGHSEVPATGGDFTTNLASGVSLFGANSYSGGTILNAGTLGVGHNSALGSGPLTIAPFNSANYFLGSRLTAANPNLSLANNIVLNSDLNIDGLNSLTLTGNITNGEFGGWGLLKNGNFTLTLSGNNTFGDSYRPSVTITQGSVIFTNNTAAGAGSLGLVGPLSPIATFSSSAPIIHGLFGDAALGLINLAANSTLTIRQDDNSTFRGGIAGAGASVQKQWFGELRLEGASTYGGGTWIKEGNIVAANNTALGTGPIRFGYAGDGSPVNANLVIESGTTLSNAFATGANNYGYLMGSGTLSPPSAAVFGGANQITLSPGTDGVAGIIGQLGFGSAGVVFGPGGAYEIDLRNAKGLPGLGWDTLNIAGGLQITATPATPFNLRFTFRTLLGEETSALPYGFNVMAAYNWRIASTGAGITGFDPTKFAITDYWSTQVAAASAYSSYYDYDLNFGQFLTSVSGDNKNLFLNFSPARYWTGATGKSWTSDTNWRGKLAPLTDASAGLLNIVYLGSNRFGSVTLDSATSLLALKFGTVGSPSRYSFDGTTGATLAIGSGGISTGYSYYETLGAEDYHSGLRATFAPNIGISLSAPQTWQLGYDSSLTFKGVISGPGTSRLTLAGGGSIYLLGANTYLGDTDIGSWMRIGLGGNSPFGGAGGTPGRVTVNDGVTFATTSGPAVIPNPIDLKSYDLYFDGYHGGLSLTGPVTLFQSTRLRPNGPGPLTIAGNIAESGGAASLTITSYGTGTVVLQGTNTYTGGTFASSGGRIIFASAAAIPATGLVAIPNNGTPWGYIGLGFVPAGNNVQTAFVDRFDKAGTFGYLGLDTPNAAQTLPNTYSGALSLAGFNADVRLGSASRAILSGSFTPQGAIYLFGGGGGTLEVSSPLTGERAVSVVSPSEQPLTLRLSNASATTPNTFLGGVQAAHSAVVFASSAALPASGDFTPYVGGYIGLQLASSPAPDDPTIPAFLNRFPANHSTGFFGFDAAPGSSVTVTGLDLTRFGASVTSGLGVATTTNLTLAGTLTLASGSTSYRFAGYKGGILTVASPLSDLDATHPRSVVIGDSIAPATAGTQTATSFLDSVVKLTGTNSHSGGTYLNEGRLIIGNSSALGSGGVTVSGPGRDTSYRTIEFGAAMTLANSFQFNAPVAFDSAFDVTLTGAISSGGWEWIKRGNSTLTLSGVTSGFQYSRIVMQGGTVKFTSPFGNYNSLTFEGAGGTVDLASGSSIAWGLNSEVGVPATVNLATSSTELVVAEYGWSNYAGAITGPGRLVKDQPGLLSLGGNSTYAGGTQIRSGTVVATSNTALGAATGPVTLGQLTEGYTYGTLATGPGVTLANPVTITAGSLAGFGTFAAPTRPAIGPRALLSPGGADDAVNRIGTLSFGASGLEFAGGGEYRLEVQDPFGAPGNGYDTLAIAGGLQLSATPSNVFTLRLLSLTPYATEGALQNFNPYSQSFSLTIATFSSLSGGFDPGKFALNIDAFSPGPVPDTNGHFFLSATPTTLLLNFTPVPEPSTYALLLAGLGALGLASRRRRR